MTTCLLLTVTMATHAAEKSIPAYTIPAPFTVTVGIPLSKIFLPLGFSWETPGTYTSMTPGTQTVRAKFTPVDTENYEIVSNIPITINYVAEPPYVKPTHDIVFLLDNSGSLGLANFNLEKQAIIALCDAFAADPYVEYRIAVIDFEFEARTRVQFSKINGTGANYAAVRAAINAIPYIGGNTATADAVFLGYELLRNQSTADYQSVFLLTDGGSNTAGAVSRRYGYTNSTQALNNSINRLKNETNATTYSIGFTSSINMNELRQFATSDDHVYTAANAGGLADIVKKVSEDFFKNDYSLISTYMGRIPSDLSIYTQSSITAVNNAITQIIYGDKISQAQIDSWADALLTAINNLTLILQNNLVVTCANITYGQTPNPVITNPSNGAITHTYAVRGSLSFSSTVPTNAGEYTVKVVSAATATYYSAEASTNFTILPKSVTITGITATKAYDGTNSFTGTQIDISNAVITGIINSDVVNLVKTDVAGTLPSANVGSGNLALSGSFALAGANAANYILTEQPTVAASITKAAGSFGTPNEINAIYTPTLTLSELALPTGYVWNAPTTALSVGNGQTFTATFTDPSGNYNPVDGVIKVNVECVHNFSELGKLVRLANCENSAKHKAKCSVCGEEHASDLLDGAPAVGYEFAINAINFPDANFRKFISENFDHEGDGMLTCDQMLGIKALDVSGQNISDLTGIGFFTGLQYLYCQDNNLTTLDVSNPHLQYLYCQNNQLTSIDVSDAIHLMYLTFSNNQVTSIDVSNLINLKGLICDNNNLTELDASNLKSLAYLSLEGNQITMLKVSQLADIEYRGDAGIQVIGGEETQIIEGEDATIISVYPNPTAGKLYIKTANDVVPALTLYSLQGKELLKGVGKEIDLSAYPQGIYLLNVNGKVIKVVKK